MSLMRLRPRCRGAVWVEKADRSSCVDLMMLHCFQDISCGRPASKYTDENDMFVGGGLFVSAGEEADCLYLAFSTHWVGAIYWKMAMRATCGVKDTQI